MSKEELSAPKKVMGLGPGYACDEMLFNYNTEKKE